MCDEYDEERMRTFWRQLAMREDLAKPEAEPAEDEFAVLKPITELEPKRARRQNLVH